MSDAKYAVIVCRPWMNETGYGSTYSMPSGRLGPLFAAVREGFRAVQSDDFNIGKFRDGRLVDVLWMADSIGEPPEVLDLIAEQIGVAR